MAIVLLLNSSGQALSLSIIYVCDEKASAREAFLRVVVWISEEEEESSGLMTLFSRCRKLSCSVFVVSSCSLERAIFLSASESGSTRRISGWVQPAEDP